MLLHVSNELLVKTLFEDHGDPAVSQGLEGITDIRWETPWKGLNPGLIVGSVDRFENSVDVRWLGQDRMDIPLFAG